MATKIETKPERTLWQQVKYVNGDWVGEKTLYLMRKGSKRGHMVSSLCDNDMHMPALDIDFLVVYSKQMLTFWKGISKDSFLSLLQTLAVCGIISEKEFHQHSRDAEDVPLYMIMEIPVWFSTIAPVSVKPSSTEGHFHLFIDKPIMWREYKKLLLALHEAGIIGSDFLNLSLKHEQSFLFLPGQKDKIELLYIAPK